MNERASGRQTEGASKMTSGGQNWAEKLIHQDAYTTDELAELLDMSEAFISQEVNKGNLRGRKLGNDIVDIPREAVLDWMNKRERGEDGTGPTQRPTW
jgi:excisionase family DNA binding protein